MYENAEINEAFSAVYTFPHKEVVNKRGLMMDKRKIINCNTSNFNFWKEQTENHAKYICANSDKYHKSKEVLKDIYDYMRCNYGIVWEYEFYKWTQKYGAHARYLDVIFSNKTYKSIFDSILLDRVEELDDEKNKLIKK